MKAFTTNRGTNNFSGSKIFNNGNGHFFNVQTKPSEEGLTKKHKKETDFVQDKSAHEFQSNSFQSNTSFFPPATTLPIQKKINENEESVEADEAIQKKELVQLKLEKDEGVSANIESKLHTTKGGGSPLPEPTRNKMESGFGTDFSSVRVHNDTSAVQMNKELGAKAFTHGNDIYFNQGNYEPSTASGQHLLAHELTHTIQQGKGKGIQKKQDNPTSTGQNQKPKATAKVKLSWWERAKKYAFEKALGIAGLDKKTIMGFLNNAGPSLGQIFKNPGRFVNTLMGALGQGFGLFRTNIGKHLKAGLMGWLFGTLTKAGVDLPKKFTPKSMFVLTLQVLSITTDTVKQRMAKRIGPQKMVLIEKASGVVGTFLNKGMVGLWELLKNKLSGLKDTLIGMIKEWVMTRIVMSAVTKILSLFNPVSGIATIIQAIYNVVKFLIERASQITTLFSAVAGSVHELAWGRTKKAALKIEQTLVSFLPIAISFFASLLGLGGVAGHIKKVIKGLSVKIWKAIDKGIAWMVKKAKALFKKKKVKNEADVTPTDRRKHKKILKAIDTKLKKKEKKKYKSLNDYYKFRRRQAVKLMDIYQKKLRKGINLTMQFTSAVKDKKDKDIDIKFKIAPNTEEMDGEYSIGHEGTKVKIRAVKGKEAFILTFENPYVQKSASIEILKITTKDALEQKLKGKDLLAIYGLEDEFDELASMVPLLSSKGKLMISYPTKTENDENDLNFLTHQFSDSVSSMNALGRPSIKPGSFKVGKTSQTLRGDMAYIYQQHSKGPVWQDRPSATTIGTEYEVQDENGKRVQGARHSVTSVAVVIITDSVISQIVEINKNIGLKKFKALLKMEGWKNTL